MAAFLLRYQECLNAPESTDQRCGTETTTNVEAEQADTDPDWSQGMMGASSIFSATGTVTKVMAEQSDHDPQIRRYGLFTALVPSRELTTQTVTLIAAEANDKDRDEKCYQILPDVVYRHEL